MSLNGVSMESFYGLNEIENVIVVYESRPSNYYAILVHSQMASGTTK